MTGVNPSVSLTLEWLPPSNSGCLPITGYIVKKNGVDLAVSIPPSQTTYTDDISIGGSIGTVISYQVRASNSAGDS